MTSPPKTPTSNNTIKYLCSYGGRIIPRPSDGLLRYVGGSTRLVSVPRSSSFSELMEKLKEVCGHTAALRCQLPSEDLDVLVSIKSDEDLRNVIEEYDKAAAISGKEVKIRAFLSPPKSASSPSLSSMSCPVSSASSSPSSSPDLSPSNRDRYRKPPLHRNMPRRVYQYRVVGDCYHNYYPSHLQPNISQRSTSSPYFSPRHSNFWH